MKVDIRTKLLIVALFSLFALVFERIGVLAALLLLNLIVLRVFNVSFNGLMGIRKLIYMWLVLIMVQSFFVQTGEPVLALKGFYLLTTDGIYYGVSVVLRFLILMGSSLILINCNSTELVLALVKLRVPYEIVFMIQLGIRFMPVFISEIRDTLNGIQLRGVDLRKVYKRKVIKVYISIFSPIIYSVWKKAEKMSILLELRGFRSIPERTYYRELTLRPADYAIMGISLLIAGAFLYWAIVIY
jgi:energy-coupling factor transport system permease protein